MTIRIKIPLEIEVEDGADPEIVRQIEMEWAGIREKLEAILAHNVAGKCGVKITLIEDRETE